MKNINRKLNKIIKKYNINTLEEKTSIKKTEKRLYELINKLNSMYEEKECLIIGDIEGLAGINKYCNLKKDRFQKINIYDEKGNFINGWESNLNKIGENTVILVSTKYGRRYSCIIKLWSIVKNYNNVKIIDIYDYLYINNCYIYYDYWMYSNVSMKKDYKKKIFMRLRHYFNKFHVFKDYGGYYERLNYAKISKDIAKRNGIDGEEKILRRLISTYIEIRDFSNSFNTIEYYINNKYDKENNYKNFMEETKILLEKIKTQISLRGKNDIIVNWVDEISFDYMKNLSFLSNLQDESISFDNAYTVMPWTTWTIKTMFSGKYAIDDKMFLFPKVGKKGNEYSLIKYLLSKKIKFVYIGPESISNKTFYNKYRGKHYVRPQNKEKINYISTMGQWNSICNLLKSHKRCLLIIHNMYETHSPYFCIDQENWDRDNFYDTPDKKLNGAKYIDRQLEFYNSIYNNTIQIYMSDHGEHIDIENKICNPTYSQEVIHTFLFINNIVSKGDKTKFKNGLFSLVNFKDLVISIVEEKDLTDCLRDEIKFQIYDTYNKGMIDNLIIKGEAKEGWMQNRGVVTLKDKYILFSDGEERYFLLNKEKENLINKQEYYERVEFLRKICTDNFIDINLYDFFKNSRILHEKEECE